MRDGMEMVPADMSEYPAFQPFVWFDDRADKVGCGVCGETGAVD
jgi:hypothetical protein